jgi:DNA-binding NarL/FixJ family response regulator
MKRLLIVADHTMTVFAIRSALRQTTGFQIVGCLDGRHPMAGRLVELVPEVVLVDDMHDHGHALARLREVAEHAPEAECVLLTSTMDDGWLADAFEAGARTALCKGMHPVTLGTLLREVVRGTVVHRPGPAKEADVSHDCPLTTREIEILRLAAQGMTNGRIARQLWVTEQTVKFHLSNTYRKLGVANRTEASRYAHVNHLVAPHEHQLAS